MRIKSTNEKKMTMRKFLTFLLRHRFSYLDAVGTLLILANVTIFWQALCCIAVLVVIVVWLELWNEGAFR